MENSTARRNTESDALSGDVILKTEDLDFYYGGAQALYGISMSVPRHAVSAIIGPSGCGKSTFLRCLNRMNDLLPETRVDGRVLLDGENIYAPEKDPVDVRRRVGMVFQAPNPLPKSISANVAYRLRAQGQHDDRKIESIVEESLRKANLWDEVAYRLDTSALSLSGGQQQRLCIARALAVEPEIILMDEPASSLDPLSAGQIEDLLFELKKEFTVVIVTHNMEEAARIGDMTAFFLNGYLVEVGETKAIFTDPERKETSDYITGRFG